MKGVSLKEFDKELMKNPEYAKIANKFDLGIWLLELKIKLKIWFFTLKDKVQGGGE